MIKLAISGACGNMGQTLTALAQKAEDIELVAGVDPRAEVCATYPAPLVKSPGELPQGIDVLVDFSLPVALSSILDYATDRGVAVVLAATGYSPYDVEHIAQASARIPVFRSANMSLGVNVLSDLVKRAAGTLGDAFDVEIVEKHHRRKVDAPSGTAYLLAHSLESAYPHPRELVLDRPARRVARGEREIGIVSVRGGTVTGEHEVGFYGDDETLLLTHIAQSRGIFARGALRAVRFIAGQPAGLYGMEELLLAQALVQQVQVAREVAMIAVTGIPARPDSLAALFGALRAVNIDMISQTAPVKGQVDVAFSLPDSLVDVALSSLSGLGQARAMQRLTKLSIEGVGMAHTPGVTSQVFDALAEIGVVAHLITTSETKIALLLDAHEEHRAVRALKKTFSV